MKACGFVFFSQITVTLTVKMLDLKMSDNVFSDVSFCLKFEHFHQMQTIIEK